MTTLASWLWESARLHAPSMAIIDPSQAEAVSYRQLLEAGDVDAQKKDDGFDGPIVIRSVSGSDRAQSIFAAAAASRPFFITDPSVLAEEETRSLLSRSYDWNPTFSPQQKASPATPGTGDSPFCYQLRPGADFPLSIRAMGRRAASQILEKRSHRLALTADSCVLSLLEPLSPGYPFAVLSSLLAGAQFIDAGGRQDVLLEDLLHESVTHIVGSPDRVGELLALCSAQDVPDLRCVTLHGPTPDPEFLLMAQELLQDVACLRCVLSLDGETWIEPYQQEASRPDESVWLHGCEISLPNYAQWMTRFSGIRDARIIPSESGYLACYLVPDNVWDAQQLQPQLDSLPAFARPRIFYLLRGDSPLSTLTIRAMQEQGVPLAFPKQADVSDPVLRQILHIWTDVLGLDAVVPEDSFTRLGGTSYQMTQVFARIKEAFPIQISFLDLYKNIRAAALADFITQRLKQQGLYGAYSTREGREA